MTLEHHPNKNKTDKAINKKRWNKFYREWKEDVFEVDENIPRILNLFKNRKVKRILDLGCGAGRHIIFFSQKGFEVYGIDLSPEGVKIARQRLNKVGLPVNLKISSIYGTLPYKKNFFDAVICIRTLNHARIKDIRRAIQEIERVLKSRGIVFITIRKRISEKKRLPYINIAPRTYIPTKGREKGVVHYLFNKELLRKEFKNFKMLEFWIDRDNGYYCFLGELKPDIK